MQQITLQQLPCQSLSVILDENRWDITIRLTNGTISVSLIKNNEIVIENLRAVAGMRIIPCKYQEDGNFAIVTQDFAIPDYTLFGVSQYLVYLSPADLAAIRIPFVTYEEAVDGVDIIIPADPVVSDTFFDPIAALPLRYKPQGYVLATP